MLEVLQGFTRTALGLSSGSTAQRPLQPSAPLTVGVLGTHREVGDPLQTVARAHELMWKTAWGLQQVHSTGCEAQPTKAEMQEIGLVFTALVLDLISTLSLDPLEYRDQPTGLEPFLRVTSERWRVYGGHGRAGGLRLTPAEVRPNVLSGHWETVRVAHSGATPGAALACCRPSFPAPSRPHQAAAGTQGRGVGLETEWPRSPTLPLLSEGRNFILMHEKHRNPNNLTPQVVVKIK